MRLEKGKQRLTTKANLTAAAKPREPLASSLTTLQSKALPSSTKNDDRDRPYHIIFSTGCTPKQHWQSYVLFHSIMESNQPGLVTRIASGCDPEQTKIIQALHVQQIVPMGKQGLHDSGKSRFHLHITPDFKVTVAEYQGRKNQIFHYLNKPYGVAHWMEHVLGYSTDRPAVKEHNDKIIMLLDPDMIVLRPIINDFKQGPEIFRKRTTYPRIYKVTHGHPMAQEYAYQGKWYTEMKDIRHILPPEDLPSPVQNMTLKQITENYASGPPYLVTALDFYKIVVKWRQLVLPVQAEFPDTIMSEMYAYSWAAAHLELPHQQIHSLVASDHTEEAFHLFSDHEAFPSNQMCRGNIPNSQKPHILHYCQRYKIGMYDIGKHRVPPQFVGSSLDVAAICAHPLMVEPPTDLATRYDFWIDPGSLQKTQFFAPKNGAFTKQEWKDRVTYLLCEMIAGLNRAARYFKQQHCAAANVPANMTMSLNLFDELKVPPEVLTSDYNKQ